MINNADLNLPLVSICVVTYNSRETVLETLDSIYAQSYSRLELLVSDDSSTDDTVSICQEWTRTHKDRFERTEVIVREENGGVAANLNTVIKATKGEWIKCIAADDLLLPNCIEDNMEYCKKHTDIPFFFSKAQEFHCVDGQHSLSNIFFPQSEYVPFFEFSSEEQYRKLLTLYFVPSMTSFISRDFAISHPFPEEYPYCEDYPYWLRIAREGIALTYFDKLTVFYRAGLSLTHSNSNTFVGEKFHSSATDFFFAERYMAIKAIDPMFAEQRRKEYLLGDIAIYAFKNRQTLFSRTVLFILKRFMGVNIAR